MPARKTIRNSAADREDGHVKERRLQPAWWPNPVVREAYSEQREAYAVEREAYAVEREARRYAGRFYRFGDRLFVEITGGVDVAASGVRDDAPDDFTSLLSEVFRRLERIEELLATFGFEGEDDEEVEQGDADAQMPGDEDDQGEAAEQPRSGNNPVGYSPGSRRRRGASGPSKS